MAKKKSHVEVVRPQKHRWEYGMCIKCQKPKTDTNESRPCKVEN